MNFDNDISLNTFSANANRDFNEIQNRLSVVESNFETRMDGKTRGSIIGSLIGTVLWAAMAVVGYIYVGWMVNYMILIGAMVIIAGLIIFMLIDNIMDFSYYGRLENYRTSLVHLQSRVKVGKSSIKANHDAFMSSRKKGWNFDIVAAPSIPEEATAIETTLSSMEAMKKGIVNGGKNAFYYLAAIAVTVVGGLALFPYGESVIMQITGETPSYETLFFLNVAALVITCIGEALFAKLIWSKTDCEVTWKTLFALLAGPVTYIALVALGSLVVLIVVTVIAWLIGILAVLFAGACVLGLVCGG